MAAFSILSDFEVSRSLAAIEAVGRSGKPVAEVGNVRLRKSQFDSLSHDLKECLQLAQEENVKAFVCREGEGRWSYGFYRHPWVLGALEFLRQRHGDGEQWQYHRDWISGLLFGYSAEAIQRFITAESAVPESMSPPGCGGDTEGTSRLCSGRSHSHSLTSDRYLTVG